MRNRIAYNETSLAIKSTHRSPVQPVRRQGGLRSVTWQKIRCLVVALLLIGVGVGFRFQNLQIKERNARTIELLQQNLDKVCEKNEMKETAIKKKMDLEEVQKIAVEKLGMSPVKQDQIIRYETTADDYFHVLKTK